jgi:xanthine/uracil/vitamin C permease (AzgA family)
MRKDLITGMIRYPYTWLALLILILFPTVLLFWFNGPLLLNIVSTVSSFVLAGLYFVMTLQSREYRDFLDKTGLDENRRELFTHVNRCPVGFGKMFREAVDLIDLIKKEFTTDASGYELDFLLANLSNLCKDTASLYERSGKFGDETQKARMKQLLAGNVEKLSSVLGSLKTLSGNLTLINSSAGEADGVVEELKSINLGLSEAIKETSDEK